MLALAHRTKQLEKFALHAPGKPGTAPDATGAECRVKRAGSPEHVTTFGPSEAKALGLMEKDNYKKQPGVMFGWRAVAANLRMTFPDAISGLYTPDEMGAEVSVSESGEMEVSSPAPAPTQAIVMPKEKTPEVVVVESTPVGISNEQRALLFKLSKIAWGEKYEDHLRKFIKAKFNTDHTASMTPAQFDEAVAELKEAGAAKDASPSI